MSEKDTKKNKKEEAENETREVEVFTLSDEDGNETEFEVIGSAELKGTMYYAMIPLEDDQEGKEITEYVILKETLDSSGEKILCTIDDDDEFDDVADFFDDAFDSEIDYDDPADK